MAAKKPIKKSGGTRRQRKKASAARKLPCDVAGLMLIGLGLFSAFSIFTNWTGVVGVAFASFLFGTMGMAAYALPVLLMAVGWLTLIAWDKRINGGKVLLTVLAALFVLLLLQLFADTAVRAAMTGEKAGFIEYNKAAYAYGKGKHAGSGALGAALTYPIQLLLGRAGGFVLAIGGLLGCLAYLTHLSLTHVGRKVTEAVTGATQVAVRKARENQEARRVRRDFDRQTRQDEWEEQEAPRREREFKNEQLTLFTPYEGPEAAFTPLSHEKPQAMELEAAQEEPEPPPRHPLFEIPVLKEQLAKEQPAPPQEQPPAPVEQAEEPAPAEPALRFTPMQREEPVDNPSVGDFDDEFEAKPARELPKVEPPRPQAVAPVPEGPAQPQEMEYLYGKESVPAIDPDAVPPYRFPPLTLLKAPSEAAGQLSRKEAEEQEARVRLLEETLASFGIEAKVIHVSRGPAITRYELQPARGVKVSKITGLADDIALNMAAVGVRIEAPIPGKAAVGIEIANSTIATVTLREVLESEEFRKHPSKLAVALGRDIAGTPTVADLARMPHLLIAGATGSGKSVCINSLIASILYKATPEEVKLILIDPKVVELSVYNGIPHLLIPVVTDPKKAASALGWAVQEMTDRYKKFAATGCRDLKGYNEYAVKNGQDPLPQIVVVIDELADLMMVAPGDVEDRICRLAQLARAAGIHLVIATQRPSVNVITGVIKANIPSRIAFAVASQVDSRTILDMAGAEKLLGRGDMLFDPSGANKTLRVQGAFISDSEVTTLVDYVKLKTEANYDPDFLEVLEREEEGGEAEHESEGGDELLPQAVELAIDSGQISASMLQRRFRVGYARAGRLLDEMEKRKLISGFEGSKPRQVLITREEYDRVFKEN